MATELTPEQRRHQRATVGLRCRVADGTLTRYARIDNLAADGARVVTALPPPVGTRLAMTCHLATPASTAPASDGDRQHGAVAEPTPSTNEPAPSVEVRLHARVMWRSEGVHGRGGVMGVRFTAVSHPELLKLAVAAASASSN